MPKRKLPAKDSPELAEVKKRYQRGECRQIAAELGMAPAALKNAMNDEGIHVLVDHSHKPIYDKPLRLTGSVTVLGEPHIPYHDADFINHVFELSLAWGIKRLVLPGDFLDMTAFSNFSHRPTETWADERNAGIQFFDAANDVFEEEEAIPGNHLRRWLYLSREQLDFGHDLLSILGATKLRISDYDLCYVNDWVICHPRNASVIAGRVPTVLARKYGGKHVAGGHGHLGSMGYAEDGGRLACDIGCTVDPLRLDWVAEHVTTRPNMCLGSLILMERDGVTYPHWLHAYTDWQAMKRMY